MCRGAVLVGNPEIFVKIKLCMGSGAEYLYRLKPILRDIFHEYVCYVSARLGPLRCNFLSGQGL